jgi:hypothetical protein
VDPFPKGRVRAVSEQQADAGRISAAKIATAMSMAPGRRNVTCWRCRTWPGLVLYGSR